MHEAGVGRDGDCKKALREIFLGVNKLCSMVVSILVEINRTLHCGECVLS